MITIDLSEVSALAPHIQPGSHEPIILTQGGQAVAAVFPASEADVRKPVSQYQRTVPGDFGVFATTFRIGGRHCRHRSPAPTRAARETIPRTGRVNPHNLAEPESVEGRVKGQGVVLSVVALGWETTPEPSSHPGSESATVIHPMPATITCPGT